MDSLFPWRDGLVMDTCKKPLVPLAFLVMDS